ncbi:hypothetical protein DV735_g254, partial [Chaetothyriales sp. CBS 134920]
MSADFWASYLSGALGILIGNHLDVIKVQYQAATQSPNGSIHTNTTNVSRLTNYFRGAAAPILGYGALNSILFVSFNRSLKLMDPAIFDYTKLAGTDLSKIWVAGAIGGLATFVVSAPTEFVKCRAQLLVDGQQSSYGVLRDALARWGVRGLYTGGVVTALRDSVGYGWYFWSYELCKRLLVAHRSPDPFADMRAWETLVAGGIAGVVTWASVYPLDVIKTRIQTGLGDAERRGSGASGSSSARSEGVGEREALLGRRKERRAGVSSLAVAKQVWQESGLKGFYRGLGICSLRAFVVNAVQWYCYEEIMGLLTRAPPSKLEAAI